MQDLYIYPAVFTMDDDGVAVEFPDLPGCVTCAETEILAMRRAREVLAWHLWDSEREREEIPAPSSPKLLSQKLEQDEYIVSIEVFMPPYRHAQENKATKVTTTLPMWLKAQADEAKINYSSLLQNAIKETLKIDSALRPRP
jgi:predicted RNase H-like HicB family nuclease